jgi:IS5 family transposase
MKQVSLGLNLSTKKTRKREFLEQMNKVVPWDVLVGVVEPRWPKAKTGRPPFAIETMLRIHYLQQLRQSGWCQAHVQAVYADLP